MLMQREGEGKEQNEWEEGKGRQQGWQYVTSDKLEYITEKLKMIHIDEIKMHENSIKVQITSK